MYLALVTRVGLTPAEKMADALEILGCVDARMRRLARDGDADSEAVRKRAQLLERFETFDCARPEPRKTPQEAAAVGVQAEMTIGRQSARDRRRAAVRDAKRTHGPIPGMRYRCAAEIKRIPVVVEHDLDDVGIRKFMRTADRRARGCDLRVAMAREIGRDLTNEGGFDQWFITLHVDDNAGSGIAPPHDDFGEPVSARSMIASRHDSGMAVIA